MIKYPVRLLAIKPLQNLFWLLHKLALRGMNYGAAAYELSASGEFQFISKLAKAFNSGAYIFDVGAHRGKFAQKIAELFPDSLGIYAFEPIPVSFSHLIKAVNHPAFYPVNSAVGETDGSLALGFDKAGSVLTSAYFQADSPVEFVASTSIDLFCVENNIAKIDFLKIDVEGHELAVLRGASAIIRNGNVRVIQFEFGNHQLRARHQLRDFFEFLDDYVLFRVLQDGLKALIYSDLLEIYQVANYVAIHKSEEKLLKHFK